MEADGGCRCVLGRSVAVLVFRPDDEQVQANVRQWLEMLAAQSEGAHIVLVCTHADTPSEAPRSGHSVQDFAEAVAASIRTSLVELNSIVVQEVERLRKQRETLRQLLEDAPRWSEREKMLKEELLEVRERLRRLVDKAKRPQAVQLLGDRVWCVDSVNGNVKELREALVKYLEGLPFMREKVPRQWRVMARETIMAAHATRSHQASQVLMKKQHVIDILELAPSGKLSPAMCYHVQHMV